LADLAGQIDEQVGLLAHGADDHDDLVALFLGLNGTAGRGPDFISVGNASAAEFLYDQTHLNSIALTLRMTGLQD
jgi:hypothetical protein